jgi:hypothetical protein
MLGQSIFALHAHSRWTLKNMDLKMILLQDMAQQSGSKWNFGGVMWLKLIKDPTLTISVNHFQFEFTFWLFNIATEKWP